MLIKCYKKLGMEKEAEEMLKEVSFYREIVLGANHCDTINIKAEYANYLKKRGKIDQAE